MSLTRFILATTVAIGAALAPLAVHAQAVTIKYSSWLPGNHWLNTSGMLPWAAEVEKATQGRVKVEILPKTVGTPPTQFDVVRDGLADLSIIVTGYTPGRFVLAEMGELPFNGEDAPTMSPLFDRTYRKHFAVANEFKGVEVLSIFTVAPGHIFTAKKEIKTIDDLKGLKLRSPSNTATRALTLLGSVPILKSSTEAYELLSTGMIDGSLMFYETVKSTNSTKLLHYGKVIPGGVYNAVLAVVINADKWNSISEVDRKAIMSVSADTLARKFGLAYEAADRGGLDAIHEAKYVLEPAGPGLVAAMKAALAPMDQEWIERAKKKGITDPALVLAEFRREADKAARASK